MVPKPTPGEWRFTLDFVRLNDCTSDVLEEETKKSERLVRDRSKAIKNLAEAESGARRQGADFSNRDGTITTLTDKLDKVTRILLRSRPRSANYRGTSTRRPPSISSEDIAE